MRPDIGPSTRVHRSAAVLLALLMGVAFGGAAAGQNDASAGPSAGLDIVVTTGVLGAVISDLVGDRAHVNVLMANGVDPHDWSPSARDIEAIYGADLVVTNGLGLEEGLLDALAQAEADGVRVFQAADHITVRRVSGAGASPAPGTSAAGDTHEHGPGDPHFWVDPISMIAVVDALAPVIGDLGVDVSDRQADLVARLTSLDQDVRARLEAIPSDRRTLVTGHESMGYFADRYGLRLVGAVVPGLSSQGEVSARGLAELAQLIRDEAVPVVFTEIGTPRSVADAIAAETGARLVELPSHTMPADGSYFTFITQIAGTIADALS
jgi:zinc/manganese transport system substrate-binding protein